MRWSILLFLICFSFLLHAKDDPFAQRADLEIPTVELTDGLPNNIVNNSVSVISGEYVDSAVDFVVQAPMPIVYSRAYSSLNRTGSLYSGWNHSMARGIKTYKSEFHGQDVWALTMKEPHGSTYSFVHPMKRKNDKVKTAPFNLIFPRGFSNLTSPEAGRRHIKNTRIFYNPHSKEVKMTSGAGEKFSFAHTERKGSHYFFRLKKHKDLKGREIDYPGDGVYISKNSKTKKKYAQLNYVHNEKFSKHPYFSIESSDGRSAKYSFLQHEQKQTYKTPENTHTSYSYLYFLEEVRGSHAPTVNYRHVFSQRMFTYLISEKSFPDHHFLRNEYYEKGKNRLEGPIGTVKIEEDKDHLVGRVRCQQAPVGSGKDPITTQRYAYKLNFIHHPNGVKEPTSGSTDVYDAYWHKSQYDYDDEHHLTFSRKFLGGDHSGCQYQPYSFEYYSWGGKGTTWDGNLVYKCLVDAKTNQVHSGNRYHYDDPGRLVSTCLFGKLTGRPAPDIWFAGDRMADGAYENDTTCYSYSGDGLNLVTAQWGSDGIHYSFNYHPGSDLLYTKFASWEGQIRLREFYLYDEDGVLVKKITDDGCTTGENDLTGVTERHIIYSKPRQKAPFGLPEQVDEVYLDLATGEERLLKRQRLHYDRIGHLVSQENYDANGQHAFTLTYEYNKHGKVTKEIDALGQVIIKEYDANDNMTKKEGPHPGYRTEYQYDFMSRPVTQKEFHKDGRLHLVSHKYDYLNQRTSTHVAWGEQHSSLDTHFSYDDLGRMTAIHHPEVLDEQGKVVKPVEYVEYDIAGFVVKSTDALGRITTYENNARGKPLATTFPDGSQERFIYRLDGKLEQKITRDGTRVDYQLDPLGRVTLESAYGADGQLIKSIQRSYNALHLLTEVDAEGTVFRFTYDGAGRPFQTYKNELLVKELSYDSFGRIGVEKEWYTSHHYRLTTKRYDNLDRLIEQKVFSDEQQLLRLEAYEYDVGGNKTLVRMGEQVTRTLFNSQGNPIQIIDSLGNSSQIDYNYHFRNALGQEVLQTSTTDAQGNQTIDTYDAANHLVQVTRQNAMGMLLSRQHIFYNVCGKKVRVVDDVVSEGKVIKSIATRFAYTPKDELSSLIEAEGTPEQKTTYFHYNQLGQKVAKVKPDGVLLLYTYDALGRLKNLSSSDRSIDYTYEYNGNDLVTCITDAVNHQKTLRSYNSLGQLGQETLGNGLTLSYSLDLLNRATQVVLPDKSTIEYEYDAANLLAIRRRQGDQLLYAHTNQAFNLIGKTTQATLAGNAGSISYEYDGLYRLTHIQSNSFNQQVPPGGYNAIGNLLSFSTNGVVSDCTYNDLSQLTSEKGAVSHQYVSDSLSNRLERDGVIYTLNHLNQVIQRGEDYFEYDINGNLTKKIIGDQVTVYTYDALDRLTQVSVNGQNLVYTYDSFHRRLSKQTEGQPATLFFYQGEEEIGTWDEGAITQLKVNATLRRCVAIELNSTAYVPLQDLFGNIVQLLDLAGNLVESYRYSAFGEVEILNSDATQPLRAKAPLSPWGCSNKRLDSETGLVAYGLRYYLPDLGRWLTPDPAGFEDGSNLYAYVHNNPLRYYDLQGLFGMDTVQNIGGYIANGFRSVCGFLEGCHSLAQVLLGGGSPGMGGVYQFSSLNGLVPINPNEVFREGRVGYPCGICTNSTTMAENLDHLSELAGEEIYGFFDPTKGALRDAVEYLARLIIPGYSNQAKERIKESIMKDYNSNPDKDVLKIAHSRGCLDLRNALRELPPEVRERVCVIAVAPGAYIDDHLCKQVRHLVSPYDLVPRIDFLGRMRCQNTIVTLKPQSIVTDHCLTSSVYNEDISKLSYNFHTKGEL